MVNTSFGPRWSFNPDTRQFIGLCCGSGKDIHDIYVSQDRKKLTVVSWGESIEADIWDIEIGKEVRPLLVNAKAWFDYMKPILKEPRRIDVANAIYLEPEYSGPGPINYTDAISRLFGSEEFPLVWARAAKMGVKVELVMDSSPWYGETDAPSFTVKLTHGRVDSEWGWRMASPGGLNWADNLITQMIVSLNAIESRLGEIDDAKKRHEAELKKLGAKIGAYYWGLDLTKNGKIVADPIVPKETCSPAEPPVASALTLQRGKAGENGKRQPTAGSNRGASAGPGRKKGEKASSAPTARKAKS